MYHLNLVKKSTKGSIIELTNVSLSNSSFVISSEKIAPRTPTSIAIDKSLNVKDQPYKSANINPKEAAVIIASL